MSALRFVARGDPEASRPVLLILRALGLGDLLAAVPALRAIARAFPEHERVLALPAALAPLALHTGTVDRALLAHGLAPLAWHEEQAPDVAVNLHGRGPSSHAVLRALSPRLTFAFACEGAPECEDGPSFREDEHEVARWCRMLEEHGVPADPGELDVAAPSGAAPPAACGATLLHPGAASPARMWPVERWCALALALRGAGHRIAITGGPDEVGLAERIARAAGLGERAVLAGRTGVMDLTRAVAAASRVVSCDTGVAHLATALRRPSVVLFGPTPPALWGPPPDRPWHRALWAGTAGDPHADEPDPGLLRIQVEDVVAALADLPEPPPARWAPAPRDTRGPASSRDRRGPSSVRSDALR